MKSKLLMYIFSFVICMYAEDLKQNDVSTTIQKGTSYLLQKQNGQNIWQDKHGDSYPIGETALTVLTLIKCGVDPENENIRKAFEYLDDAPIQKTYEAALYLMAMEAKFKALTEKIDAARMKKYKKYTPFRILATNKDLKRANKALKFLETSIIFDGMWGYPSGAGDHSNTQYAMLGLFAAERMGISVDQKTYLKVIVHFIETQEKSGPEIDKSFSVPAAEEPISWEWREQLEKKIAQLKRKNKEDFISTLYPKYNTSAKMKARGWKYRKDEGNTTGSMTTAGIACMVIAKAYLEKSNSKSWQKLLPEINESIRDGCAWIAHNFRVDKNPNGGSHYYYLYGLERAGILAGVELFGEKNWYVEGAKKIIKDQKDNGSLNNSLEDTCFALLFLKRATMPVRTNAAE